MSFDVVCYTDAHCAEWEAWCAEAQNATFLHTRRFLSYHGPRFKDESALIFDSGKLRGVFPAAAAPSDADLVVSHLGATFGGIVHQGWLTGERMLQAIEVLREHYRRRGFTRLRYKAVPFAYSLAPSQDDLYALYRLRAERVQCDLSCTIDLRARRLPAQRRRRALRKARRFVQVLSGSEFVPALWDVVAENLARKHSAAPVHSAAELALLCDRFSDRIQVHCAAIDGAVHAGVILFNSANVWHAQYIASSEEGYAVSALDAVFDDVIRKAEAAGVRYFDFGTSNEQQGWVLNDGLYRFKAEFGGSGMVHEQYELVL